MAARIRHVPAALLVASALAALGAGAGRADSTQVSNVTISVQVRGTQGSVISLPRGISCPDYCVEDFPRGSQVALYAGSRRNSGLAGWRGACVGAASSCVISAQRDTSVTATFERKSLDIGGSLRPRHFLYVTVSGSGRIRSSPAGINCPGRCEKSFRRREPVTLEAVGSRRPLWTEGYLATCSGRSCRVTMTSNAEVSATFPGG
jgi:hypothetical protein